MCKLFIFLDYSKKCLPDFCLFESYNLFRKFIKLNSKVALVDSSKCKICIHVSSNDGTLGNTPLFTERKYFNEGISKVFPLDQSGTPTYFNSKKEWIGVEVICD